MRSRGRGRNQRLRGVLVGMPLEGQRYCNIPDDVEHNVKGMRLNRYGGIA